MYNPYEGEIQMMKQVVAQKEARRLRSNEKIIGYKFSVTGVYGCKFYSPDKKNVCSLFGLGEPPSPIVIKSEDIRLRSESEYGEDGFLIRINIRDTNTGRIVARIKNKRGRCYEIDDSIDVINDWGEYIFSTCNTEVASIQFVNHEGPSEPKNGDYEDEPIYEVYLMPHQMDPVLKMLIMAFPFLDFPKLRK